MKILESPQNYPFLTLSKNFEGSQFFRNSQTFRKSQNFQKSQTPRKCQKSGLDPGAESPGKD